MQSANLELAVQPFITGWNSALERVPRLQVSSEFGELPRPRSIPIPIRAPKVRVKSFQFSATGADSIGPAKLETLPLQSQSGEQDQAKKKRQDNSPGASRSRLSPPNDIIKLPERLFYVLQPPLELLVDSSELEFPFKPFPYQYEGVAFLYPRHSAILADEMGLGKTMQAITTVRLLLAAGEIRHVLFVCPKPLVTNWQREFALWAPEVPVAAIEGSQSLREWQWKQDNVSVKIANYELLMRDQEHLQSRHFDLVVLDEAQRIKNRRSSTSQVVCSIPRTRSWALTGTPVENSVEDLVGIFEFLVPNYLHREMTSQSIGNATRDHVLRRTKERVLDDMPPKMYRDAELSLHPSQMDSYQRAEEDGVIHLNELGQKVTIQHVFELVLRLKQICNFDPTTGESVKLDRLKADLEEVAASGHKAIVFSQWVHVIDELSEQLCRFKPLQYHGRIPSKRRDDVIEQFKSDDDCAVLLMSYGAGSVGLNLQFCQYVFLFDRWWNPAVEDQAINRAHRIGVAGPVTVTRMVTLGTIEERINEILEKKRELFAEIFDQVGPPTSGGLTQEEIFGLFTGSGFKGTASSPKAVSN